MDVNAITQLISNIGFPVAVCLICFWYINKQSEEHKAEIDELTKALNNNTLVMQRLADRLSQEVSSDGS